MEFYREVRTRPWADAFKYATVFFVLITFAVTLLIAPSSFSFLSDTKNEIREQIPDGTTFEIKDDNFSTSLEPATEFGSEEFILTIDDTVYGKDFPKAFEDRVGIFIGRDAVFIQEPDGSREIIPFDESPELAFTKEDMLRWIGSYGVPVVLLLLWLVWLFSFLFSWLGGLLFVLFMSLISSLAGRVWKLNLNYYQWLAVGFHAITLPTILDFIFSSFGLEVPFLVPVVFFMFIFAVLSDERARPVKPKPNAGAVERTSGE